MYEITSRLNELNGCKTIHFTILLNRGAFETDVKLILKVYYEFMLHYLGILLISYTIQQCNL